MGLIGLTVLILLGVGLYLAHKNQEFQNEMVKIVHSEEVKNLIEKKLKKLDPHALTEKGKIRSYKIDDKTIRHNPMGGIMFTVYINGDREIYLKFALSKHTNREDSSQSSEDRYGYSVSYPEKFRQLVGE